MKSHASQRNQPSTVVAMTMTAEATAASPITAEPIRTMWTERGWSVVLLVMYGSEPYATATSTPAILSISSAVL
ncbi:hypothetical protein BMS3Bbin02_00261 [bacterium BMS3Bbin02]|nr:hypothetical protein BMS3Bbin02_00261 [bacterium BMS3Bbin02]